MRDESFVAGMMISVHSKWGVLMSCRALGHIVFLGVGLVAGLAQAQEVHSPFSITAGVGSTGWEVGGVYAPHPMFSGRLTATTLDYSHNVSADSIRYSGKLKFSSGQAGIQFHPLANGWNLEGGVIFGDRKLDLRAAPTGNVTINGKTYTPSQVGVLTGKADLGDAAPFLAVGYDDTATRSNALGIRAVLGVAFTDKPKVSLNYSGASDPNLSADIEQSRQKLQNKVKDFRYYPIASIGLSYRF